jgi:hypothetical protein
LVTIKRRGYQVATGGIYYPLDYLLEIHCWDGESSPELKKDLALLAAHMPYRQSQEVLKRFRPYVPSHMTFRKAANEIGEKAQALSVRAMKPNANKTHVTFQVDGGRINTLEGWRETKTAIVENGTDLVQVTKIESHKPFMDNFCEYITQHGYNTEIVAKALLSDGAQWIGDDFLKIFPEIFHILDYYHLTEHFYEVAKIVLATDDIKITKPWVESFINLCFENRIAELILKLQNLQQTLSVKSAPYEAVRLLLNYVKTNKDKIRYGFFESQNLPIGSGKIEATVKQQNNSRMKSGSIRWKTSNANKVLALRSAIFNDQYHEIKIA